MAISNKQVMNSDLKVIKTLKDSKKINATIMYKDLPIHINCFITMAFNEVYIVVNQDLKGTSEGRKLCSKAAFKLFLKKKLKYPIYFFRDEKQINTIASKENAL